MKAYVGQIICNDEGEIVGKVVRIHEAIPGENTLYHVPFGTPIGFGQAKYYRSEDGRELE